MGKRAVHVIHVPRWITVLLLILVSAAMAMTIHFLSGHAYQRKPSFLETIANILFFAPWGALAFLSFDHPGRSRRTVYGVTVAVGLAFALALLAWQATLPNRVTGWLDVLGNAAGCALGAMLGHARKRVRIRFE